GRGAGRRAGAARTRTARTGAAVALRARGQGRVADGLAAGAARTRRTVAPRRIIVAIALARRTVAARTVAVARGTITVGAVALRTRPVAAIAAFARRTPVGAEGGGAAGVAVVTAEVALRARAAAIARTIAVGPVALGTRTVALRTI